MTTPPPADADTVLAAWTERNLSEAAQSLPGTFEMEAELEHAAGILCAGRNLLLVGEPGIGKTALVTEIARRASAGANVMQLSVGLRLSRLRKEESLFEAFATLMDSLPRLAQPVVLFIRDGDLLHHTGLASQLDSFCLRQPMRLIVEGRPSAINAMLEVYEAIGPHFVALNLEEPGAARTLRILEGWSQDPRGDAPARFSDGALEESVYLTHRFLSRNRLPRKAMELLSAAAATATGTVTADVVIERFCAVHNTARWLVDPSEPLAMDSLEERFRDAVLGQDDAVTAALSTIAMIKAGLSDMRRPFGVFLFVGPTGVGKTHLAQLLARELFGASDRMVRIDMGDFSGPRGAATLFGDPEHQLPGARRGVLAERLMGRPFGVVLLDEFEKAHPDVHDRLLPLIDEGTFSNGAGESVSCRSCIIIATSNAGAEVYRESALGFTTPSDLDAKRDELGRRVKQTFRFELLNRFDRVVHFQPLSRGDIRELAERELEALEQRPGLRRRGTTLVVDEAVLDWLTARGYDAQYGARFLKRTIEREVSTAVADALVRAPLAPGERILLDLRRGRVRARRAESDVRRTIATTPATAATATLGLGAGAVMERAAPRLEALAQDVAQRDQLLSEMAHAEFWEDDTRRMEVTERFRSLDVSTRLAQRFARPIAQLCAAVESGTPPDQTLLVDAASALAAWEERERLEGVHRVWLLLCAVDGPAAPRDWMLILARMYMAWCRRTELRCAPVAFESRAGDLIARLVLEVEGPGAEHFLDAERGVHRRRRASAPEGRVRVDVVAQQSDGFGVDVRDRSLSRGPFALMASVESTLSLPHTGQTVTLASDSRATLAGLVGDLSAAWSVLRMDSPEIVRSYGEPGGLVTDPRTGASAPLRAVERGQLDAFIDAWERRRSV